MIFAEDAVEQAAEAGPPITKLIAFFETNANDDSAQRTPYPDFPQFFTWNSRHKMAVPKAKRSTSIRNYIRCVGCIPTVSLSPHQVELYYLWLHLHPQTGTNSFENLRRVNNYICPTFQEACRHLGLIEDDKEINKVMQEATAFRFGHQLRAVLLPSSCTVGPRTQRNSTTDTKVLRMKMFSEKTK